MNASTESKLGIGIGFDVYGTLVNPLEMQRHLRTRFGDQAEPISMLWREKQVEYAFRRGLMRHYENFGVCTRQALQFALASLGLELSAQQQEQLLEQYQNLPPFPDVLPALQALRPTVYKLVAFSNGAGATVRNLLERAGIWSDLKGVISVDDLRTFKPDPKVYRYLAEQLRLAPTSTWLVSGNPWDVIGAKSAGLRAAWVKRNLNAVFDPWGIEPDFVVTSLEQLPNALASFYRQK